MDFEAFHRASLAPYAHTGANCFAVACAAFPHSPYALALLDWWGSIGEDLQTRYATLPNQLLMWDRIARKYGMPPRARHEDGIGLADIGGLHTYCATNGRAWFARSGKGVRRIPQSLIIIDCGV